MSEMEESRLRLSEVMQAQEEWPQDLSPKEQEILAEQLAFRRRMEELARGLVGSEYWELLSLVLVEGLEDAKGALEIESTDDKRIRICQGEAKAYRSAFNLIIQLSKAGSEEKNVG